MPTHHRFGGEWTTEKLERVRKYLVAYATIMNKQKFRFAYIDAFAGTGYRAAQKKEQKKPRGEISLFDEFVSEDTREFLDGSARIALQVRPRFNKYIFIERDPKRFSQLQGLKLDFPDLADDIILEPSDANEYIARLCKKTDWRSRRAVLFLDPYGMQVPWETIEAIAGTQAIDLWLLFPLGVAVNRMVTKDGQIAAPWRQKLDRMFGDAGWYEAFYRPGVRHSLFGEEATLEKVANFDSIGQYFVSRLQTVFAGVAQNPLPLFNSRNNPLYLLCFAAGNPKGSKTAVKIAGDILRK